MSAHTTQVAAQKILVVDDKPDNLRFFSKLLTDQGYQVRKAINGKLALDAANLEPPDLILLDILMPDLDGYQVCRCLRECDRTRHIPIIFVSALDEAVDKVEAFKLGGTDYISKPFNTSELLARVTTHLKLAQLQQQLSERNWQLEQEVKFRIIAEKELKNLNLQLETVVQEYTTELKTVKEQLIQLQMALQKALTKEHELSEFKSELIATISHEFRTPLSVIKMAIELLRQSPQGEGQRNEYYFQLITESILRISHVLQDVIILAEAKVQNLQLNLISANLVEICQRFIQNWQLPPNSLHQLSFQTCEDFPDRVEVDITFLELILRHLISNAIRYSPNGGNITITLHPVERFLVLKVQDQGLGISAEEQPQIFSRFYRGTHAKQVPGTPGTGLGLSVIQCVLEVWGGTIAVNSEVGKGSTFTVTLPRIPPRTEN